MIGASAATPVLTIAIVSSHCLVRLGLQTILENEKIGYVAQMHQRMTPDVLLGARRPDLFILDLETVRDIGDIIQEIREAAPTCKIVLLCGFDDKDRTCEAVAYGVDGILLKIQPPEVVLATIKALSTPTPHYARVSRDGSVDGGSGAVAKPVVDPALPPVWLDAVTAREREIIRLVGQGLSNKEIAHRLCVTDSTVRHHLTNIFDKVGVSSRQKLLVQTHQFCSASTSSP